MGKKQEISTEQDFDVFKILYTSSCKTRQQHCMHLYRNYQKIRMMIK